MSWEELRNLKERARVLIDLDRYEEAIPLLQKTLTYDPDDAYSLCSLSLAYDELGDHKQALTYADRAIEADPEEEWGYRLRSIILRQRGDLKAALQAAEEAARLEPDSIFCLNALSSAQLECDLIKEAEYTANQMVELNPDSYLAHFRLGFICSHQERLDQSEEHYRKALTLDPNSAMTLNNLGVVLLRQGKQREAAEFYYQALTLDPVHTTANNNLDAILCELGYASMQQYIHARTDADLQQKIKQWIHIKRDAEVFLKEGRPERAIAVLHQALTLLPDFWQILDLLAEVYTQQGRLPKALQYVDDAIRISPTEWRGQKRRSQILHAMSKTAGEPLKAELQKSAVAAAEEAVRLSREKTSTLLSLILLQLDFEMLTQAEHTAKRLIECAPKWAYSYSAFAGVCSKQKHWRLAEMYYRRALQIAPDSADIINDLGVNLLNQGKKSEATDCFKRACKLDPSNALYVSNLIKQRLPRPVNSGLQSILKFIDRF